MSQGVSFGRLIRSRRRALDMTQKDLAQKVGYSVITIRKVEANERRPSRQLAEALAQGLQVAPEERPTFVILARSWPDDGAVADFDDLDEAPPWRARGSARTANLPSPLTRLIGREQETVEVRTMLQRNGVRLLTLVGPPGIGKSRLGLQVATELVEAYPDGVYSVALAPVSDPVLVPPTVAKTLNIKESASLPLTQSIIEHLSERSVLLLLDNFEHMLPAASFVAEILTSCPGLTVLATSRAPLNLRGEALYSVPPMALPDPVHDVTAAAVARHASAELFVERAQAVKPDFALTDTNAADISALCAGLEGLPLAIELVAARVKFWPPHTLLSRLNHRLALLTDGPRDLPERQQTLRGTIDWSYDLLDPGQKVLFARLSVFNGGCSLATAEEVCDPKGDLPMSVLDGLTALADKNLLRHEERVDGERYFHFFEAIREYAAERLVEFGEDQRIRARYGEHYLGLAERANDELAGEDQEAWLYRLDAEHNNFRSVLEYYIQGGTLDASMKLVAALWKFWRIRAHQAEGRRWISMALALPVGDPCRVRAQALYGAGWIALDHSDHQAARAYFDESLTLYRTLDDQRGIAEALHGVGMMVQAGGDDAAAVPLYAESLELYRDLRDEEGIAWSIDHLGCAALSLEQYERAEAMFDESTAIFRRLRHAWGTAISVHHQGLGALAHDDTVRALRRHNEGLALFRELENNWGIAASFDQLGYIALHARDHVRAESYFRKSLSLNQAEEDRDGIARSLLGLASTAVARKRPHRAAQLFGAVEALAGANHVHMNPVARHWYEHDVAVLNEQTDPTAMAREWAYGRSAKLRQIIGMALGPVAD
jgi:predicted ATPase/DNA-binding XRE family transcriptional regulator